MTGVGALFHLNAHQYLTPQVESQSLHPKGESIRAVQKWLSLQREHTYILSGVSAVTAREEELHISITRPAFFLSPEQQQSV